MMSPAVIARYPLAWRAIRQFAAVAAAGDIAVATVRRLSIAPDCPRERLVAIHESGHAIMRFFVTGRAGATAAMPGGGIAGDFTSETDARAAFDRADTDAAVLTRVSGVFPARFRRLMRAVGVFMQRYQVREAVIELAELTEGRFASDKENTKCLSRMFPDTPAYRRAVLLASQPDMAPAVAEVTAGGTGAISGGDGPDRAGATCAHGDPQAVLADQVTRPASGLTRKMDPNAIRQNLTISERI
jgi:sulfur relay (sulfurtransferase) DsrC/TusE family protein